MRILLAAVNASYSHTCLAARAICEYVRVNNASVQIDFAEWTINQSHGEILEGMHSFRPDLLLFPTYIWNTSVVESLVLDAKKILPGCTIGAGGPEFGYNAKEYMSALPELDFVVVGEGEQTVLELSCTRDFCSDTLKEIKGLYYRGKSGIEFSGERELLCDLSVLPFPYPVISECDTRIYYYESSRGCPFSCAYCISSLERSVRFMPLECVFADLQRFLDAGVRLVKFVDRTYNLDESRYLEIWKYILAHHNGKTMFHFEIEAEFLGEAALEFLQTVPAGVMQFEMGIQSANKRTLRAVCRSDRTEVLAANIRRIPRTIHQHLDLIAGLPHEDLESFGISFDFAMNLEPDMLQLGFLKILHGTQMESYAKQNGWKWTEKAAYETLATPSLPYADMIFLKHVEILVDAFWNSGSFRTTIEYAGKKYGFWSFFSTLARKAQVDDVFCQARRESFWFEYIAPMCDQTMLELLRFDYIRAGKRGSFPAWYERRYDKTRHRNALENNGGVVNARLDFAYSDYDEFLVNPLTAENIPGGGNCPVLFLYARRDGTGCNKQIPQK